MSTPAFAWSRTDLESLERTRDFAREVCRDLSKPQKELHSKYLYDELGSALFEAITRLPEYGLTRADERVLRCYSPEIARLVPESSAVIELGSGTGEKTRYVLNALRRSGSAVRFFPIDVSSQALARCESALADIAEVYPIEQPYLEGMANAVACRRPGETFLVLFLGSTIGNFERPRALAFLQDLRRSLAPGDLLLVGADLVKDRPQMLLAYDDPIGLTAAFNLNLLGRINRELGANFELRAFQHEARWNEQERRIEMHLRSRVPQTVTIGQAGFPIRFEAGETIWTESSHKFLLSEMRPMAEQAGFQVLAQWVDREWPFVESLWAVR